MQHVIQYLQEFTHLQMLLMPSAVIHIEWDLIQKNVFKI